MTKKNTIEHLEKSLINAGLAVQRNTSLAQHTTFKIGGPAELFITVADEKMLITALKIAHSFSLPHFLLGGGSNLLVREGGISGLTIQDKTKGYSLSDSIKRIKGTNHRLLTVASGHTLADLVYEISKEGYSGMEFLAGIPGTIGGAVCGNAGAYGLSIADILINAKVWRNNEITTILPEELDYEYRNSRIKKSVQGGHFPEMVVLSATFKINDKQEPQTQHPLQKVKEFIEHRKNRLPDKNTGCGGSYFKNLPPLPGESRKRAAGLLLDQAGAKKLSVGDARVFKDHANVIINSGSATASDVLALAEQMKELLRRKDHIELEAEVMTVGKLR